MLPFEFARSDTCVVQCFKTADYSNYRRRERIYAALWQRVKRHRPRCKVSLMLPRIISVCMCLACGPLRAGVWVGVQVCAGVDIRCPRAPREIRKARPRETDRRAPRKMRPIDDGDRKCREGRACSATKPWSRRFLSGRNSIPRGTTDVDVVRGARRWACRVANDGRSKSKNESGGSRELYRAERSRRSKRASRRIDRAITIASPRARKNVLCVPRVKQ